MCEYQVKVYLNFKFFVYLNFFFRVNSSVFFHLGIEFMVCNFFLVVTFGCREKLRNRARKITLRYT